MRLSWVPVFTLALCLVCLDLAVMVPVVGAQTKAEVSYMTGKVVVKK